MIDSLIGMAVGGGRGLWDAAPWQIALWPLPSAVCRPATRVFFTETAVKLPGQEIAYEELFYRSGDAIRLQARNVELIDRCYANVAVRLQPDRLQIGEDTFDPEKVLHMEAVTTKSCCRAKRWVWGT